MFIQWYVLINCNSPDPTIIAGWVRQAVNVYEIMEAERKRLNK